MNPTESKFNDDIIVKTLRNFKDKSVYLLVTLKKKLWDCFSNSLHLDKLLEIMPALLFAYYCTVARNNSEKAICSLLIRSLNPVESHNTTTSCQLNLGYNIKIKSLIYSNRGDRNSYILLYVGRLQILFWALPVYQEYNFWQDYLIDCVFKLV